jgi:glycosyltransferase involved in cell wall biosynthesis
MRINIYTALNGVGLERDYNILRSIFEQQGHSVDYSDYPNRKGYDGHRPSKCDIAFHLEIPRYELIGLASKNIVIPNPEWFETAWLSKLNQFDAVYAKTRDCERIFSEYHNNVVFTSFTSLDKYDARVTKEKVFLHVAGKSSFKGTSELIQAYGSYDLPLCYMTTQQQQIAKGNLISTGRLSEPDFNVLVNACLIHVCPSYYEGFGHYLWEAMSCGAVVITTDAPPMNEFDTDYKVKAIPSHKHHMGMLCKPDVKDLADTIKMISNLDIQVLLFKGQQNRQKFLDNDRNFRDKIISLLC